MTSMEARIMTEEQVNDLENINLQNKNTFVMTQYVKDITSRALSYLNAGYPVHLKGCAGVGKTMIALHLAQIIAKPTTVIFGNEGFQTSDMVGLQYGFRKKVILDNYVHSVQKRVEDYQQKWMDGRIVDACENGYTLIYDEFTRSRPETNNILLSVLEEKVLELPISYVGNNKLIKVHPEFKAIFTSNPEEYAGVYKSQDALIDRLITIELEFPDKKSELEIVKGKSGMAVKNIDKIITIVREFREQYKSSFTISLRESIKLCKVIEENRISIDHEDELLRKVCIDILTSGIGAQRADIDKVQLNKEVISIINSVLSK